MDKIKLEEYCVNKINSIPNKGDFAIDYIDISSVDNSSKKILGYNTYEISEAPSRAKQLLELGDVLVSTVRPNLNAVALCDIFADNILVGSTGFCVLRGNDKVNNKYLYYFCQSKYFVGELIKVATGASYPAVSKNDITNILIPNIKIEHQNQIVKILDAVKKIINNRKEQLELLDELVKSRFVELFGDPIENPMSWEMKQVDDVCSSIYGGGTPSKKYPEYFDGEIPWVTPKDMKSLIIRDSIDHITEEAINNSSAKLAPPNSVLMVIRSGILKHTLPVAINKVPVTVNQDMKIFVPNKHSTSYFLTFLFKMIEQDVLSGVRSVTADNIDFSVFRKRLIPIPPIELQNIFVEFVLHTDKLKTGVQKSLEETQVLFDSLMKEYFD